MAIRELFDGLAYDAALYVAGFVDAARVEERVIVDPDAAQAATTVFRTFLEHVGEGVDLTAARLLARGAVSSLTHPDAVPQH